MNKDIILNIAKILGAGYVMFISLFALDEWGNWLGLFMHLIPTFILIAVQFIAWKNPKIGGIILAILGLVSIAYFNTYKSAQIFLIISLPLIIVATLFILSSYIKKND